MIPVGGSLDARSTHIVERPSRTWGLDFARGRAIGVIDGLDAVRQAVAKILRTERFRHLIYNADYGVELAGLLGRDPVLIRSDLPRVLREALTQDDRIQDVTDLQVDISGDRATVKFTVESSFGDFQEEVSVNV